MLCGLCGLQQRRSDKKCCLYNNGMVLGCGGTGLDALSEHFMPFLA